MTDIAADGPFVAALFLTVAMSTAGVAHVLWLRSAAARRLALPLDGGLTVRGRRLFGDNKMLRGLVMLPPAAALAFPLWAAAWSAGAGLPGRLWPLSVGQYALLGFACGFAFMLAELPNSFMKRQFGIAPGATGATPLRRTAFFVIDRLDSVLGVLVVASLLVPMPPAAWGWVLLLGPSLHAAFSVLLHRLKLKARAL